ncbi:MAG: hypothetical protein US58_C0029G0002 [Candidatus Magasanikbacteria bacterium GW2011_GWA2_37_8]|uniref:Polymerase nucleotidyl transferase domain-containing protein n=1 Tax=Candidatus Magasanikbacteria bacterium GW2011_GWA2_37_8 TaxID=1619036 RepID=A0A0G0JS49_9BACT|nr:MAG: hypothetical protein US58_C0029G0002 [Candidatus Magasanikbacteria bacterium GW2011_GWA2_37_8]
MLTPEVIKQIQTELQSIFPRSLVLLGGSYLWNETDESSDADFYVVGGDINFWLNRKSKKLKTLKNQFLEINITWCPRVFFIFGWYDIYGQDLIGNIYRSPLNYKINWRNTIKLGYFYCLQALTATTKEEKNKWLKKASKRLAWAQKLNNKEVSITDRIKPYFSFGNLAKTLSNNWSTEEIIEGLNELVKIGDEQLKFSLINYLIYNIKFIVHKDFSFLNSNPDKKIILEMQKLIQSGSITQSAVGLINRVIFPVYIL